MPKSKKINVNKQLQELSRQIKNIQRYVNTSMNDSESAGSSDESPEEDILPHQIKHRRPKRRRIITNYESPSSSDSRPRSRSPNEGAMRAPNTSESKTSAITTEDTPVVEPLNAEIKALLGGADITKQAVGAPLHKDIVEKWAKVTREGLTAEEKQRLLDKHPPPENSLFLAAPRLNEVVATASTQAVLRRDVRLSNLQNQLGAGVTAIGRALSTLVSQEEGNKLLVIEALGDASRLFLDIFNQETKARQDLLAINLNKDMKDVFEKVKADEWLFGTDLEEKLKASKELARSSSDLKPTKPKQAITKKINNKNSLNRRSPPRPYNQGHQGGRQHRPKTSRGPQNLPPRFSREKIYRKYRSRTN